MRLALERANVIIGPPPPKWEEKGKFTRKIDAAFHLGKSAEIYRQLNSNEAAIITQLRTARTAVWRAIIRAGRVLEQIRGKRAEYRRTDLVLEAGYRSS
ncbi:hypothetical protein CC78DRAFT_363418 [Lojkania enalia]|uniref:Uncharacterized protein n=1 Tax=Lojkania enalia TaxID=147567 RepID=A0A9P4K1C2_9PLEO|nr:hypothetical protein CC78DRAFT_363418 [Didymosphaeria enalia]